MKILLFLIIIVTFASIFGAAKPLDNDNDDISKSDTNETRIERIEKIPDEELKKDDDVKPKKSQRNYPPVYYVSTKVNGRFGKSVRAFTSDDFYEQYPI